MHLSGKRSLSLCFLVLITLSTLLAAGAAGAQQSRPERAGRVQPELSRRSLRRRLLQRVHAPGHSGRSGRSPRKGRCADEGCRTSTWSAWASPPGACGSPKTANLTYAWMDRIVDAMGKAGIKVILGTPTYSIPAWMAHQHPEILRALRSTAGERLLRHAPEHGHRFPRLPLLRRAAHPPHRCPLQRQPHCHRLANRQRNIELRRGQSRCLHRLPALS